jgi:hypothetical protein
LLTLNFNEGADMKKLFILLAAMLTFTSTAFAQIGSLSSDLVFTPVTPCRIMDTRNAGSNSGILLAGTTRTFFGLSSASNYPSQGSSNATCGIPFVTEVAALVLNFTTVTPAAAGFVTVFPTGAARPTAATVNFTAGSVVGNNATLKVNQTGGSAEFDIYTTSNVHVVADVVGYYSKPVATALECVNTAYDSIAINNGPIAGLYYAVATAPACLATYTSTALHCTANNVRASANPWISSDIQCVGNSPTNTETVYARQRCCRIPGR